MVHFTRPSRRAFLAATASVAATVGVSGTTTASTSTYDTVVDLTTKGADPTGSASITPYLRRYAGDDTLIRLPQGRYRMAEQFRLTGFRNFAVEGTNATIVPDDYWGFTGIACFKLGTASDPGRDLRISGLDFDFTAPQTGVRAIQAQVSDGLHVSDVDVVGQHDSGTWGPALFDVTDPAGYGAVDGFRAMDGAARSSDAPGDIPLGPTGCLVTRAHRGTIDLVHVNLNGFPDNGLYAGNARGTVNVVGGYYSNSTISNVRIGGTDSTIRWAQVVVDDPVSDLNQRGIRLDAGSGLQVRDSVVDLQTPNGAAIDVLDGVDDALLDNVDVTLGAAPSPALVVHPDAHRVVVKYTDIEANGSGYAVDVRGNSSSGLFDMYGCKLRGDATGEGGYAAIHCERDGAAFRWVYVDQPGGHHRRALDLRGDDCVVYKGRYTAHEYPIVNYGSGSRIVDSYASVYEDTVSLLTYDSDLEVARTTLENGYLNEGTGSLTAYGNTII